MLNLEEVKSLLSKLCVDLGFCLSPEDDIRIQKNPPNDIEGFTDAVFLAEGINPQHTERHLYRQVRTMVVEAFQKHDDNFNS